MTSSLEALRGHLFETSLLESTVAALEWDEHTGMPPEASEYRSQQLAYLSGLVHRRRTDSKIEGWLDELQSSLGSNSDHGVDSDGVPSPAVTILRTLRKDFHRSRKLPQSLVEEIAKGTSLGQQAWVKAKDANRYEDFLPYFRRILELRRQVAQCLVEDGQTLYDALLDHYEEGMRVDSLKPILSNLRSALVPLVKRASEASSRLPKGVLQGPFDLSAQRDFSKWVAQRIGFDFQRGRLDETVHPFCTTLGPHDHRILTRYTAESFSSGLYGVLHEAGHGMYEQGLDPNWYGTAVGATASLGVHESQSRLWENMVGMSKEFWVWAHPVASTYFPQISKRSVDELVGELRRVEPSLIRIEADEVTYNLHILLRFELELELVSSELDPADLPAAWNAKVEEYLGLVPPDDRSGVLQDVHWSAGLIGYFPTYTLGNIYAAQLFRAADRDLGGLNDQIARGEFEPLVHWLRKRVHRPGRAWTPLQLMRNATGEEVDSKYLIEHLRDRCEALENAGE